MADSTPGRERERERTIRVEALARVEGEGALTIRMRGREAVDVRLRIFEPPRFFESFLRGRSALEVPDITSRICGICPVAYQMSSCAAIEDALGIEVGAPVRALRRLFYCGEWIESHVLHMFLLHAPDFLGYPDVVAMARDHRDLVERGLRMKKAGNALVARIGGREIHPVNARVGGFHRAPRRDELRSLLPALVAGRDDARAAVAWAGELPYPDLERDVELVSLRHASGYPILGERIVSSRGLDIPVREYDAHFVERQVPYSTALHSFSSSGGSAPRTPRDARGIYLCGPLARLNLNVDRLRPAAREAARQAGFEAPCRNPFKSLLARAIETLEAFDEAVELIDAYVPPDPPFVEAPPRRAGTGSGATEAPRGLLYHRYTVDDDGLVREARIVPPTSQNQAAIEDDLRALAPRLADLPLDEATRLAEQAVRSYDPCISCATHFLKLRIERDPP